MEKIKVIIAKLLNKVTKRDKWKLYLYASNQCIKKLYVEENEKPFEEFYVITVYFKKHILGSNVAKIVVKPTLLKYTDNDKKCIHIETELFKGVEV
jgi:hypothetical protein